MIDKYAKQKRKTQGNIRERQQELSEKEKVYKESLGEKNKEHRQVLDENKKKYDELLREKNKEHR